MEYLLTFLPWHYTKGLEIYVTNWLGYFDLIIQYFSLPLLIKTLFSPWKRLVDSENYPGFDFSRFFEQLTFNWVSRIIGAIVRFSLFIVGSCLIILTFLTGIFGLFAWFLMPFLGIFYYMRWIKDPKRYVSELVDTAKDTKNPLERIFASEAGKVTLTHLGLDKELFLEKADTSKLNLNSFSGSSFADLLDYLIKNELWTDQFFRKNELEKDDVVYAAKIWDKKRSEESFLGAPDPGAPGIGLELMFGYTPTLNRFSEDLSSPRSYSHRLIGREQVVVRMERVLTGGSSVALMGEPGIGKKTVVLEFAHRAHTGLLGKKMAYRRVVELDHNSIISSSQDTNKKKSLLLDVLQEAAQAGNIILVIRDIHRLTNPDVEGLDFTDIFEKLLSQKELMLIVVATPVEYERFIAPNMRLRKHLEAIEIPQPTMDEAFEILLTSATKWESTKNITITIPAIRKILEESDRYITETPFPEKALELLDAVVLYREQRTDGDTVTIDDVNTVLSEKTGISFARLTGEEKKKLGNLEEIIHQRLVNQNMAVDLIAKSIRARTIAITKKDKPLGSYLFLGPTGVGKTQTAKVLAEVYFGSRDNILRFDMAEFAGREGFERLVGSVSGNKPGELTTAIKNNPASLLLLDELEKATPDIFNLFLRLLDEGEMTDAFGKKIIGKNLFIIGTSNAGAEYIRQLVSQDVSKADLQKLVIDNVLKERIFSPEFINRFDGVIVYEPLKKEHLVKVANLLLQDFAKGLKSKNLYLEVSEELCEKLADDGYNPAFGARPMERIVNLVLGDLIGTAVLSEKIDEGDHIKIIPETGKDEYRVEKIGHDDE